MPESLASLPASAATALVTYLLHSTLLLLAAWLVIRLSRTQSHLLVEQIWKTAALSGLITTSVHLSLGFATPVFQIPLATTPSPPVDRRLASRPSETPNDLAAIREERSAQGPGAPSVAEPTIIVQHATPTARQSIDIDFHNTEHRQDPPRDATTLNPVVEFSPPEIEPKAPEIIVLGDSTQASRLPEIPAPSDLEPTYPPTHELQESTVQASEHAWLPEIWNDRSMTAAIVAICVVVIALVGRLLLQMLAFVRRVAKLRPLAHSPACLLLDELCAAAGIRRRAALYSSHVYSEPVAFGVFRWRIVLPAGLDRELSGEELRALLAHELAHLVRGDTVWLWIGHVLCSLFAFQPLNFLARRGWRRAAEFQCDDWAVTHSVPPLALARCLTQVAERRQMRRACAASLSAIGAKSTLSTRVERLVAETERNDPWRRGRRRRVFEISTIVVISGLAVWGPCATMPTTSEARDVSAGDSPGDNLEKTETATSKSPVIDGSLQPSSLSQPATNALPSVDEKSNAADFRISTVEKQFPLRDEMEIKLLRDEMNNLVVESQELLKEASSRPELRPVLDSLIERIASLERKIARFGKDTPALTPSPTSY